MKIHKRNSLWEGKSLILIFTMICVLTGCLGTASIVLLTEDVHWLVAQEAENVAKAFAHSIVNEAILSKKDLSIGQLESLQNHIVDFYKFMTHDIVVVNSDKRILADVISKNIGQIYNHDLHDEVQKTLKDGITRTFIEKSEDYNAGIQQIVVSVAAKQGDIRGAIIFEYTPLYEHLKPLIQKARKTIGGLTIAVLFVSILMGYLLSKRALERKSFQEDLKNAKEFLDNILNTLDDPIFVKDEQHRWVLLNDSSCLVMGGDRKDLIGKTDYDIFPKEQADVFWEKDNLVFETGKININEEEITWNGKLHTISTKKSLYIDAIKESKYLVGNIRDITEQKRAIEDRLKLAAIVETSDDAIIAKTLDGNIVSWNNGAEKIYGYSAQEVIGKHISILCPQYLEKEADDFIEIIRNGENLKSFVTKRLRKDGNAIDVSLTISPIKNNKNEIIGASTIARDITHFKHTVEDKNRLLKAIEQVAESIVITDIDGSIQYINPAFIKTTGYSLDESLGKNPSFFKSNKHDNYFYRNLWLTITRGDVWEGHLINRKKDGTLFEEAVTISPVKNESGVITNFVAVKRDVTDEVALEKQLQQSQKFEAVGTLAGGIAHDFNNILSSIIGFTELALDDSVKGSSIENSLQEVYSAGKRAKDLVKQILTFARQSDEELKPIKAKLIVKEVVSFLRSSIPTTIKIKQKIKSESWIMGNPTQLHQVLMNLCTNAAYAMEKDGGTLEVGLTDIRIDSKNTILDLKLNPCDYVKLIVSDTGTGISPEIIETIFEPYFTTKPPGEGTGLGLALIQGIVEKYNGKIIVESELGKGSVFTIYFPIFKTTETYRSYGTEPLPTGSERILFVDDEMSISKMGDQILSRLGYSVAIRSSSVEALELFKLKPFDFDLVITDMTMPNMTGDKLAVELIKIRPEIPVILCTGYSKKISDGTAAQLGIKAFVFKPVLKANLAKTVRKVLDEVKTENRT